MNRKRWALISATILALGGAAALTRHVTHDRGAASVSEAESSGFRVRWPAGAELHYRLAWKTETNAHALPAPGQGTVDSGGSSNVEAELVLKVAKITADKATLLLSLASIDHAEVAMHGSDGLGAASEEQMRRALVGPTAILEVDVRGRLVSMKARGDAGPIFADMMHALATELSFQLAQDDAITWQTEERSMTGESKNSYRFDETSDGGRVVERTREAYTSVAALRVLDTPPDVFGVTRITFDKDGLLTAFEGGEEVRVGTEKNARFETKTSLSLSLAARQPFAFAGEESLSGYQDHALGGGSDSRAGDRALAEGVERKDLVSLVATFGTTGSFPRGALAKAAAFLRLHPEECDALTALFAREEVPSARGMILDVLVSAGSKEAQLAMKNILESPAAKREPAVHRALVQRFALVATPTAESLAFVRDLERTAAASGDGSLTRVALVTRGSVVGKRMRADDAEAKTEARALLDRARADRAEGSAEDRIALVMAVGNLRHPDASDALAGQAKDADPFVRASVASALRHGNDKGAAKVLVDMMKDEDPFVARSALTSHLGHALTRSELDSFAQVVKNGGTNTDADSALVSSILGHVDTAPSAVRSVLETLLARAPTESGEAGRLRAALEGLPAT